MFLFDLIGWAIGGLIGDELNEGQKGAWIKSDGRHLTCGLRVVSGTESGLTREWTHGRATIEPGAITIDGHHIRVREVVQGSRRDAYLGETRFMVNADIAKLRTETAVLEWAVPEALMFRATQRVSGADS